MCNGVKRKELWDTGFAGYEGEKLALPGFCPLPWLFLLHPVSASILFFSLYSRSGGWKGDRN